jgi:hypothetical protein
VPQFDEPLLDDPDELPPELRLGLERLRGKRPSPERIVAIAAAVTLTAAAQSANAATPAGAEAAGGGASKLLASPATKLVLALGVVGAGAAALFLAWPSVAPDRASSGPAVSAFTTSAVSVAAVPSNAPLVPAGPAKANVPSAGLAPTVAATPALPAEAPAPTPALAPNPEPAATPPTGEPRAATPREATAAVPPAAARETPEAASPGAKSLAPAVRDARPPAPSPRTEAEGAKATEAELLRDARQVLDSNPLVALSLCEEHQRDYPRGGLTQERELIAVAALLRLGRTASAQSRAARFRAAYPRSPYLTRLDRLVPP